MTPNERPTSRHPERMPLHEPLAHLAHELRTPLNALGFSLTILRTAPDRSVRDQALNVMDRQLEMLKRFADDLFELAHARVERLPCHLELIDLNDVVRHALEACDAGVTEREHTVRRSLARTLPRIEADAIQLRQVVVNLVDNAIKYTPPGGRIDVETALEGAEAILRVSDNGMGIATDGLAAIFRPFQRALPAIGPATAGLGLGMGLPLVKAWVGAHHGTVQAHSRGIGLGSTFTVRLPLRQPAPPPPERRPAARHAASGPAAVQSA